MQGFFNKALIIDAGNRTAAPQSLDDALLRSCLGGKGLATQLLLQYNPVGVDPLAPENHLLLALGPAAGSPIYGSCRHGIFSKSPLTGGYAESYSGGKLAVAMNRCGYDAIIIHGAAEKPVWIEIDDSRILFHDAAELWGMETYAAEDAIKSRLKTRRSGVMVIGPAGEKGVRFAVVENDYWRSAGRTGMGAVLGAKNIKGIAFTGNAERVLAHPEEARQYARRMLKDLKHHAAAEAYRSQGTPMMVALLNQAGGFPTRYWSAGEYAFWEKINAPSLTSRCKVQPRACMTCFMACGNLSRILEGRHKGLTVEGPEYETIYAFGGLCMIDSIEEIAYLNDICDRLGMDTISAGNLAAFAIEASKRGKIRERLDYGRPEQVASLLEKIAARQGIGDLLADGIRHAAAELDLQDLAIHVKGLEPPGYDPRALKGMGLAYAVSDRGACHLRATFYKAELAGLIDPDQTAGKAEMFLDFEDRCTLFDCLILCRFYRDFYPWEDLSRIIFLTTGLELEKADLQQLAARVTDSTRRFNLREGFTSADDRLPKRFFQEALPDGRRISENEMRTMVADYYRLRGWSADGIPPDIPAGAQKSQGDPK